MALNQINLPLYLWLIQTLAATFLMTGFVAFELYLWQRSFSEQRLQAHFYQFSQPWIAAIVAVMFMWGYRRYGNFAESMLLANVAIATVALPLFSEQLHKLAYSVQAIVVIGIWGLFHLHQAAGLANWPFLGLLVLTIGLIGALRQQARNLALLQLCFSLCFIASFWLTWENGRLLLNWQAAVMYLLMSNLTVHYALRYQHQFQVDRQVQALTHYDDFMTRTAYERSRQESAQLFATAQAQQTPLIVAALDVDHFKQFNQTYGHMSGNATLITITKMLQHNLATAKLLYHLYHTDGEEFSIVFPQATLPQITAVMRDCLARIRQQHFVVAGDQATVTLSAGITIMRSTDQTMDAIYKRADDNLYLSKQRGRDVITTEGITAEPDHDVDIRQLAYFAQPIVQVTPQTTTHWAAELLLRRYAAQQWQLPERFDIAVDQQITLMTQALAALQVQRLTLNLTLAQFNDSNTAASLAAFAKSDRGPQQLLVEITDVPTLATLRRVSAQYRDAGIGIYIDDVGSDNSFELVCQLLPYVNGVKFAVQNLRASENEARIRQRILFWYNVANERHIDFILEGLETKQEVFYARSLGITHFQGYYFGKPQLPSQQAM